ncbi:sodium ion-translocating decarboxylase subunit beta [Oscillospiraceae bacterium LTW-04]|nr:sodium ion-translocating decarboxylase subunit beta [Oscillospiraceae bacterium MB24-C1]
MDASSIGIIGGADGPTAIFVAGKIWPIIVMAGFGAVALIALGVWLFLKHR